MKQAAVFVLLIAVLSLSMAGWLGVRLNAQATPTPTAVMVRMSDGTTQDYPLGIYLLFQSGKLRGIFPTQYVGQPLIRQPYTGPSDLTWKLNRPGRNVQIWRNGLLQQPYTGATFLCPQPYRQYKVVADPSGSWKVDFSTGSPVSSVVLGDYTLTGDMIKPRYADSQGVPYASCEGNLMYPWAPEDLLQAAYLY